MQVDLIDYTGSGSQDPANYAAAILIFSKNTRLTMTPGLFQDILGWSWDEKEKELLYMSNTIPSSWEFIDFTFLISGVTRAFTHQFVRTRTASYAQQTMRVLDVSEGRGWDYLTGPTVANNAKAKIPYDVTMSVINSAYKEMIVHGAKVEDARGILPTNILTNIMVKMDMRTLTDLVRKRTSPRVQGEYRDVLEKMKEEAIKVYPWLPIFLNQDFAKAAKDLDEEISEITDETKRTRMLKLVDQLRQR